MAQEQEKNTKTSSEMSLEEQVQEIGDELKKNESQENSDAAESDHHHHHHHHHHHSGRHRRRRRKKRIQKVALTIAIIIAVLCVTVVSGYFILRAYGKYQLEQKSGEQKPAFENAEDEQLEVVDENTVQYQGQTYVFNDQVMNFVLMGIDNNGEVQEGEGKNGRADVALLVAVDHKNKKVTIFNINRNIMTNIAIYDDYGTYLRQAKAQLALSHTYGQSSEQSAQLVCDAISNLFYGLAIHGYAALNMDAIPIINDRIGGVPVTLLRDFTDVRSSYVKGANIVLDGDMAIRYIRERKFMEEETNEERMERQKQYLSSFVTQARTALTANPSLVLGLYNDITPYMTTDLSADKVVYLASEALGYSVAEEIMSLSGTIVHTELYDEYYVDEKALYETILNIFYEKKAE